MIIGLDIGGHHVAGALVTPGSWEIEPGSYLHLETEQSADADALVDSWASLIGNLAKSRPGDELKVGIAMPGPFDYRAGIALFKGNQKFEALYGVDVGRELAKRLRRGVSIRFLNDATAFAVGSTATLSPLPKRILALTLGTGLGSAFLENGVPVVHDPSGAVPEDGCLWNLPFKESIADDYISSRWIVAQAMARLNLRCSVASLATLATSDREARSIFENYGNNLGLIVAPWLRAFKPNMIVIGGRITRAFQLFAQCLDDMLAHAGTPPPIVIHENTEDAAIIGGAKTFDETFWAASNRQLATG